MPRFDYVKYDDDSLNDQNRAKELVIALEAHIDGLGVLNGTPIPLCGRSKALALTKLEEVYMWIGKAIRDAQVVRNNLTALQEERTDS